MEKAIEKSGEENRRQPVDSSIFEEILLAYKGCGQTLGELAAQARQVENELNAVEVE